jgi:hypothetical protein
MVDLDVVAQQALVDPARGLGDSLVDAYAATRVDDPFLDPRLLMDHGNPQELLFFLIGY